MQLADSNSLEALHCYQQLLTGVFQRCRLDAVSRTLEWSVEQWSVEELGVQLATGRLVRRMVVDQRSRWDG